MTLAKTFDAWGEPIYANTDSMQGPAQISEAAKLSMARGVRRFATQALLLAATGMADGYLATVDAIKGAMFVYDGPNTVWLMSGCPRFATTGARDAAITSPIAGWRSRITTEIFDREYSGSWKPAPERFVPLPSSVVNGSVTAGGLITSTAQSIVSVNDVFIAADADDFELIGDVTNSAGAAVAIRLRAAAADNALSYDHVREIATTTVSAVQALADTSGLITGIGLAGRHVFRLLISKPALARETLMVSDQTITPDPMTTSAGRGGNAVQHRVTSAFTGFSLLVASGTLTINSLRLEAINHN